MVVLESSLSPAGVGPLHVDTEPVLHCLHNTPALQLPLRLLQDERWGHPVPERRQTISVLDRSFDGFSCVQQQVPFCCFLRRLRRLPGGIGLLPEARCRRSPSQRPLGPFLYYFRRPRLRSTLPPRCLPRREEGRPFLLGGSCGFSLQLAPVLAPLGLFALDLFVHLGRLGLHGRDAGCHAPSATAPPPSAGGRPPGLAERGTWSLP